MYELFDIEIEDEDMAKLDELTEQFRFREFTNQPEREGGDLALNRC